MAKDIFDIDTIDSVVRKLIREKGVVDLRDVEIESFSIPYDYSVREIFLPKINYDEEICKQIKKISKIASKNGFDHKKVSVVLFEGIRNAHQHGNKLNSDKSIVVAYKIIPGKYDIAIIDQGGVLDPEFVSYIQRFKQGLHKEKPMSFYDFSEREKGENNLGRGIYLINSYVDSIYFYKSDSGGLVMHVEKSKCITKDKIIKD